MNYQKHYNNLINRAKNRILDLYTERHHIIPRCIGGTDSAENLVKLTPEEHKEKISIAKLGITFSQEHKKKLIESSARKGKPAWNKGIPLTQETKEKMGSGVSKALKGRSWEDIYGIDGAAKRREDARIRCLNKKKEASNGFLF